MKSLVLSLAFVLSVSAAKATDFTQRLVDDDGKPLCAVVDKDGSCKKEVTLGLAVRTALDAPANTQGLSADEKDRRGELSQALIGATHPVLLEADWRMIRNAIGNFYPPSIVHQAWKLLGDPPAAAPAGK